MTINNVNYRQEKVNSNLEKWLDIGDVFAVLRKMKVYHFAGEIGKNKDIIDFGCGSGHGTVILAKYAKKTCGVDIRQRAIDNANKLNSLPNISYQKILPSYPLFFKDKSFDVIISSQVIEHIPNVGLYLKELKRILKDDGSLIITTPNRKIRLLPFQKPINPEHLREYTAKKLKNELTPYFYNLKINGVYGIEILNSYEKKRMKGIKNPFKAYILDPFMRIMKKIFHKNIISHLMKLEDLMLVKVKSANVIPTATLNVKINKNFSLNDIFIDEDSKKGIDLLAICKK